MKKFYLRTLFFTKLSVPLNAVMAAGKIILGILSSSFFLCINGFYNIGIGLAKFFALKGHRDTAKCPDPTFTQKRQNRIYFLVGFIVFAASVMYIIYCASKLFDGSSSASYPRHIAMIIAIVSILEIVFSLRGVIISRRDRKPVMEAIKLTNLASSLILLVLTQTAILSFATEADASLYNGITGIILGSFAALIGLYMILRMAWITKSSAIKEYIDVDVSDEVAAFLEESDIDKDDKRYNDKIRKQIKTANIIKVFSLNQVEEDIFDDTANYELEEITEDTVHLENRNPLVIILQNEELTELDHEYAGTMTKKQYEVFQLYEQGYNNTKVSKMLKLDESSVRKRHSAFRAAVMAYRTRSNWDLFLALHNEFKSHPENAKLPKYKFN